MRIAALAILGLALVSLGTAEARTKKKKKSTHAAAKTVVHPKVRVETSMGDMVVELFPEKAPKTVANFRKLVKQGFYDGILFHRVERGFVIQGGDPNTKSGDPNTWGTGGPGYQFEDEPVKDEYTKGTLCMANSGANTNGSQFFVCTADLIGSLPKKYNLFGRVVDGMETVDKINNVEVITVTGGMHRPVKPVKILRMTEVSG
ncbi:MAG: peptidylprolyl isomerase [Candidatus Eisenbacteria bacterium]|nr:peptidylprolyl isomerase [Candidatus Eisenbacteria bacterium]